MVHPIYTAVLRHPGLALTHVANYLALLRESVGDAATGIAIKTAAWAAAAAMMLLAIAFAGIAIMLGVMQDRFHWVLIAVPGTVLVLAAVAALVARRPVMKKEIHDVTLELEADRHAMELAQGASK